MRKSLRSVLLSFALGVTLFAGSVPSSGVAAASTMVFTSSDCGATVTTNVVLKSNVDCSGWSGTSMVAGASNISINLNGFTLQGEANHPVIDASNYSGNTIYGGTVLVPANLYALVANDTTNVTVSKVFFVGHSRQGEGIVAANAMALTVANSSFSDSGYGVDASYSQVSVSNSTFTNNYYGMYTLSEIRESVVGCSFLGNAYGYESDYSSYVSISKSYADNNEHIGFNLYMDGSGQVDIGSSFARGNGEQGVVIYHSFGGGGIASSVVNVVASGNVGDGFSIDGPGPMTFKANVANDNGGNGVIVINNDGSQGPFAASRNIAKRNHAAGFYGGSQVYGSGNKAYGNANDCYQFECTVVSK